MITFFYQYSKKTVETHPFRKLCNLYDFVNDTEIFDYEDNECYCYSSDGIIKWKNKTLYFQEGDWLVLKDNEIYKIKKQ